jgi:predicted nucleic acid-binding protein
MNNPIIVADASPLIGLAKLNQLELLSTLFSVLHVPEAVYFEVVSDQSRTDARLLQPFLDTYAQLHADIESTFTKEISPILDAGEIQALALAQDLGCGVIMDELRGRKVAQRYEIKTVGVLGVLMQGKVQGLIPEVLPFIEQLQAENYRLSARLVDSVLERMGEK